MPRVSPECRGGRGLVAVAFGGGRCVLWLLRAMGLCALLRVMAPCALGADTVSFNYSWLKAAAGSQSLVPQSATPYYADPEPFGVGAAQKKPWR